MVRLLLKRDKSTNLGTSGALFINGEFFCNTLEPPVVKLTHPAVLCGTYRVVWYPSTRFKGLRLMLKDVPHRFYILIHEGNRPADTMGCILVGVKQSLHYITNSRETLYKLHEKIRELNEEMQITIE